MKNYTHEHHEQQRQQLVSVQYAIVFLFVGCPNTGVCDVQCAYTPISQWNWTFYRNRFPSDMIWHAICRLFDQSGISFTRSHPFHFLHPSITPSRRSPVDMCHVCIRFTVVRLMQFFFVQNGHCPFLWFHSKLCINAHKWKPVVVVVVVFLWLHQFYVQYPFPPFLTCFSIIN